MVHFYNPLGKVSMTGEYFSGLVSAAATSCYGVAQMAATGPSDAVRGALFGQNLPDRGVRVTEEDGRLVIELHIKVTYGLNIAATVKSITHKVRYVVETATGLQVRRIDVSVDDIIA